MKEGERRSTSFSPADCKTSTAGTSVACSGDHAFYNGDWLKRAAAAKGGIYGNDAGEAIYPITRIDAMAGRSTAASTTTR